MCLYLSRAMAFNKNRNLFRSWRFDAQPATARTPSPCLSRRRPFFLGSAMPTTTDKPTARAMDEITKLAAKCRVATPHDAVTNSECVYTFHSPYTTEKGILVNLSTFVGTVDALAFTESDEQSALFVRICKKRVPKENDDGDEKMEAVKLGVGVEGGFQSDQDKFDTIATHSIVLMGKGGDGKAEVLAEMPYDEDSKNSFPMLVSQSADAIIHHAGLAVKQDLSAWELDDEPKPVSKYAESLPFVENGVKISPNPSDWKVSFRCLFRAGSVNLSLAHCSEMLCFVHLV